eukprot:3932951-Rhodomonas_salina.5
MPQITSLVLISPASRQAVGRAQCFLRKYYRDEDEDEDEDKDDGDDEEDGEDDDDKDDDDDDDEEEDGEDDDDEDDDDDDDDGEDGEDGEDDDDKDDDDDDDDDDGQPGEDGEEDDDKDDDVPSPRTSHPRNLDMPPRMPGFLRPSPLLSAPASTKTTAAIAASSPLQTEVQESAVLVQTGLKLRFLVFDFGAQPIVAAASPSASP